MFADRTPAALPLLLAAVALLAACSTDSPSAPVQDPGGPVIFDDDPVTSAFSFETTEDLVVIFTNESLNAETYLWDFGDGTTSTLFEPVHTYEEPDTYTVSLTASNSTFSQTVSQLVSLGEVGPPEAAFSFEVSAEPGSLTVAFENTSSGATSFEWDFGDGRTSKEENPSHTYSRSDTYLVTLTVTNADGSDTASAFVTVPAETGLVVANFDFEVSPEPGSLTVIFTDASTNANRWTWDFGDGRTSTEENPIHTYNSADTYVVTLEARNAKSIDTVSKFVTVPEDDDEE